jgi:hypothetical protein
MSKILDTFKVFIEDNKAPYMYITGAAGTGKTTSLSDTIEYCLANEIKHCVCAYTHKAVGILASKMPRNTNIATLHSFLKKVPTIDTNAIKLRLIEGNAVIGKSEDVSVIFIDEFSMIGNKDYEDIQALQWNDDGILKTKVIFIGDLNQLPPIADAQSVIPEGEYHIKLTKIYRQDNSNPLLNTLTKLTNYISGDEPKPLKEHSTFKRGVNLISEYNKHTSAIVLAYTNERVQVINRLIEGKSELTIYDRVFSPTIRRYGNIASILSRSEITNITKIDNKILNKDSKYRTLETLINLGIDFVKIEEENETTSDILIHNRAIVFGHKDYLNKSKELKNKAIDINKTIERQFKCNPIEWSINNKGHMLNRKRAKAWREFLAFNSCVICVDFTHALTVHKSQGSTYDTVLIDTEDLAVCADKNYKLYLQLLYVAISRASKQVFTN